MPFFSVVIPVYNRTEQFARCLKSVAAQTYRDFEVIVVDDASTEDIGAILTKCRFPVQRLTLSVNRGPGAARNAGIKAAAGEYVAFLDSDDTWFPWTLATYEAAIKASKPSSLFAGREVSPGESSRTEPVELRTQSYADYYSTATNGVWIATCAAVVQTTVLRQINGFLEERMNAEDSDLWMRLGDVPGFLQILDPPVFRYHRTKESLVGCPELSQIGIERLIVRERAGEYPGGRDRMFERRRILGRHVRPHLVAALGRGELTHAWRHYRAIFWWSLEDGRYKFLAGFWLLFVAAAAKRFYRGLVR
jgi:glycosyltransferase involved in cell wall biosynthesis